MKRYITVSIVLICAIAWAIITTVPWHGLNSLQHLIAYKTGLLDKKPIKQEVKTRIIYDTAGVDIMIDTLRIPHIFAKDDNGIAYATGFMHARDRYFQMELMAYTVMGRLSEIIGPEGIYSDENWKRFGFEEKAKLILDSLSITHPPFAAYLRSYARGVNDYINGEDEEHRDPMYLIWNYSPRSWQASYCFLIQWYMSFDLTFYDDYFDRQEMLEKLPAGIRKIIYPDQAKGLPLIVPGTLSSPITASVLEKNEKHFLTGRINNYSSLPQNSSLGSNNWVVGGGRTSTGHSFLCNDLHLFLTTPNIFYELELHSPTTHVYGFSLPGTPVIVTGHNEQVSWGITNGGWDVTELYLLKVDPHQKDNYWLNGKWEKMTSRRFPINVKDQATEYQTVQYTVFGPVVKKDSLCFALRWYPSDWTSGIQSFWELMHAGNWKDFREVLRNYDYPSQNFVYGDIHGNIGIICAGKMPVKPSDYAGGLLDGTSFSKWKYIPYDSLPQSYNPSRQFLFSANQQPQAGKTYYGCRWFSDLYRPVRINQLLSRQRKLQFQDMQEMQLDITDLSVKDLQRLLIKYADTASLNGMWKSMLNWDGRLTAYSRESIFFSSFRNAAWRCSREIAAMLKVKSEPSFDQLINFLLQSDTLSYQGHTLTTHDCFHQLMHATDSLFALENKGGSPYSFSIPQMTFLPGLNMTVNGIGGSDNTINVNYQAHPVIRTLIELSDTGIQSWMVNAIGQTGRLNDAAYLQQFPAWKRNDLHKCQFVEEPKYLQYIVEHISFKKKN